MINLNENANPKVLIIEDRISVLMHLHTILKKENYQIVTSCGEQALYVAKKEQPDIILLNLKLRNETGFSVLKKIKSFDGLNSRKVIIVSQINTPAYWDEAYRLGADAYIVNPIHLNCLCNKINKILAKNIEKPLKLQPA